MHRQLRIGALESWLSSRKKSVNYYQYIELCDLCKDCDHIRCVCRACVISEYAESDENSFTWKERTGISVSSSFEFFSEQSQQISSSCGIEDFVPGC